MKISVLAFVSLLSVPAVAGEVCVDADCPPASSACGADMPCGDTARREDLALAYQFCREHFWDAGGGAACPANMLTVCDTIVRIPHYTLPACEQIVKRWEQSAWKKADDADVAKARAEETAHEKAFIDTVAKQKPGKGER